MEDTGTTKASGQLSERRSRTRTSILVAAMHIVGEEGIAGLSMSALAARAGVSRQTLYNYCPDVDAVLAGMVELEDALQALLAWFGMESGGLDRTGVLAGLHVALMGLRPLLYVPIERNEGLYRMACSLAAGPSALAVAVLTLVAIDLSAPAFAESFIGSMAPFIAALVTLAIGALATKIAVRRRERLVEEMAAETEGSAG